MSEPGLRCPTCRAPWRGVTACPRCGTDLAPLMGVATRAWQLREAARAALEADRGDDACALASAALRLHATPRGRRLLALALLTEGRRAEAMRALAPESRTTPGAENAAAQGSMTTQDYPTLDPPCPE